MNYSENDRKRDKIYADFHNAENLKMHQNNVYGSTIIITKRKYDCEVRSSGGQRMTLSDDVVDDSVVVLARATLTPKSLVSPLTVPRME